VENEQAQAGSMWPTPERDENPERDGSKQEGAMAFADLELRLFPSDRPDHYDVEPFYKDSNDPAGIALEGESVRTVYIDRTLLLAKSIDPQEYGKALSAALFNDDDLARAFTDGCARAQALKVPLRLRLRLRRSVLHLHGLRWETLYDPRDDAPDRALTTNQNVLFSRFIDSSTYRPPRPRPPGHRLRLLAAVAAPEDVTACRVGERQRRLDFIDAGKEKKRIEAVLEGFEEKDRPEVKFLTQPGAATLEKLAFEASAGCDILYLVCHGALHNNEATLYLVDDANKTTGTPGKELALRLNEWSSQPFVIFLVSCQSAGEDQEAERDESGALAALGPQLAAKGVPAVIAMHGRVTMETMKDFVPAFLTTLLSQGAVDQAVTVARARVRQRPDWWMPVLFSRVVSGEVWYKPGLQGTGGATQNVLPWDGLLKNIRDGACTAVLGFGLLEPLIGAREEIARDWAERYSYPLNEADRNDLVRMGQFVAVDQQNETVPGDQLRRYLRTELLERLDPDSRADFRGADMQELLAEVARRTPGVLEPYEALAEVPFRVYLTTAPDSLLAGVLKGRGRAPQVRTFDWSADPPRSPADIVRVDRPEKEKGEPETAVGRPPRDQPLVYSLFGTLANPDTLVITEDNHFDYLLAMTRAVSAQGSILQDLRAALSGSAVLFLGFRITDWDFHVLLRSLRQLLAAQRPNRYTNVAVQIDPEQRQVADPGLARRYLERSLGAAIRVSIYWGSAETFLAELRQKWSNYKPNA
jgi:hypothetical protein